MVWLGERDEYSDLLLQELKVRGLHDRPGDGFFWSITSDSTRRYLTSLERDLRLSYCQHDPLKRHSLKMPVFRGPGAPAGQREEVIVCRDCIFPHVEKLKSATLEFFTRPWARA